MAKRLELHEILKGILGSDHVYFQPPSTLKMVYPCIVYRRSQEAREYADGGLYSRMKRYQVIVIERNPDSEIPDKVGALPLCSFDRHYTSDNLNHDVYNLYF